MPIDWILGHKPQQHLQCIITMFHAYQMYVLDYCCWVLLGLDLVTLIMLLNSHVTCSCIHSFLIYSEHVFPSVLSLSLSLGQTASWHPNSTYLFRLGTLFKILGHPLLLFLLFHLISSSVMRRPRWTSLRTSNPLGFIRNARSFYRISPTLCYPMSFVLRDGNLYERNPRLVPLCLYRSFTPTYMAMIPLCLILLPHSEVHVQQLL